MAYRNKTYVAFDGDNDIRYYNLMKAWKQSDNTDFNFYDAHDINSARDSSKTDSIKSQLRERMANSKLFILLLGEKTKYLTRFVEWEVEHALYLGLPIIVVNLNQKITEDMERMPRWLDNELCIICPYNKSAILYSMENWEKIHNEYKKDPSKCTNHCIWSNTIYKKLGIIE